MYDRVTLFLVHYMALRIWLSTVFNGHCISACYRLCGRCRCACSEFKYSQTRTLVRSQDSLAETRWRWKYWWAISTKGGNPTGEKPRRNVDPRDSVGSWHIFWEEIWVNGWFVEDGYSGSVVYYVVRRQSYCKSYCIGTSRFRVIFLCMADYHSSNIEEIIIWMRIDLEG